MKISIQKSNALGELLVVEVNDATSPDDPELLAAFEVADKRMLEMNNRIIVATEIERRHGPEVAMAVREVTDVMFGYKPLSEKQITDSLQARKEFTDAAKQAAKAKGKR